MGRYPFLAFAEEYLEKRRGSLAKSSIEELERKAKYLNKVLVDLSAKGKIQSTSPSKLTEADVRSIIIWMDEEGHQNAYKAKNLWFLKAICEYAGNGVFAKMRAEGIDLPKRVPKDLHPLTEEDLNKILQKGEEMKGWHGEVCRFLIWMYPFTGLRASELRQAQIEDIDIVKWTIFVRHPKGEKRYARQRTAPILPPAREAVMKYLEARRKRVEEKGIVTEALIPAYRGDFYSSNHFRKLKAELEEKVNLDIDSGGKLSFNIKMFRATFCQQSIDRGAKIESLAVAMGHASSKTTETYYGRMKTDKALDDLNNAWAIPKMQQISLSIEQKPQTTANSIHLIEPKNEITGYA